MGYRITRLFLALLSVCVGLFLLLSVSSAQESTLDFQIRQILRNDANPSVVAFLLYGTFEDQDVINMYSNDVFIKAKAINTADLVGTGEVTVDNISVDVFQTGDNLIVAKLERSGTELFRTPAFRLTVQEPPAVPTVEPLVNEEEGLIGLNITGSFKENDIVRVFLNDAEVRAKTILAVDAGDEKTLQIVGIPIDTLVVGENFFTASVRRGEHESERSEKSDPVVIKEAEEVEEEPVVPLYCAIYTDPQKVPPQEIDAYEGFGNALAARNGVVVVGTRGEKTHIYTTDTDGAALVPSAVLRTQNFKQSGSARKSVAVQNLATVLVGDSGSGFVAPSAGAVRVYTLVGGAWTPQTTIAPEYLQSHESFGSSMALYNRMLVVGASRQDSSGAVYVYSYVNGGWRNPLRLVPGDTAPNQEFGYSISADDEHIVVGAPGDGFGKNGAIYVYTRSSDGWSVVKTVQDNRRQGARFGTAVLLSDGMLFVGAMRDDQGRDRLNSGVVYAYVKQGGLWQVVQKLTPQSDDTGAEFGAAIARSGNMLAIGAPRGNAGRRKSGAVYLYRQTVAGGEWSLDRVIAPTGLRSGDRFGASVAFDGLDLLVGAYGTDGQEKNVGVVYRYVAEAVACVAEGSSVSSQPSEAKPSTKDLLSALRKQKEVLDALVSSATSIASRLGERIQGVSDDITKKQDTVVVYDEGKVLANAQRWAAERRGIIGPGLPDEVTVQRFDSSDAESLKKVTTPPTEDTVRSRGSVVQETKETLGIVVPVAGRDLRLGDVHEDVYRLQVFLNTNGYQIAESGDGSPGNETSVFGKATDRTLRWFQLVEGLPVTGVLDKKTRDAILTRITSYR